VEGSLGDQETMPSRKKSYKANCREKPNDMEIIARRQWKVKALTLKIHSDHIRFGNTAVYWYGRGLVVGSALVYFAAIDGGFLAIDRFLAAVVFHCDAVGNGDRDSL
jgi:hypothetical protein